MELRIVANADNLTVEERKMIAHTCMMLDVLHRDVEGICFIDGHNGIILKLTDGTTRIHRLKENNE